MNKLYCLIIMFFTCGVCRGQNLVPNPSFEVYDTCPNNLAQMKRLNQWTVPLYSTSPDYFNSCDSIMGQDVGVPKNYFGWEPAHTGSGYVGIITYWPATNPLVRNYREYIQVELTNTLIAGTNYYFHWYVSAADSTGYLSNNMGIYFSNIEINDTCNPPCNLPVIPQFENPITNNLNVYLGWMKISGNYTATGGEKYIIIGNFDDTTSTIATLSGWAALLRWWAYYYIDDVCVSTDSMYCNSSVGINEIKHEEELILFPNPFTDKINIAVKRNDLLEVSLYDITSRKIFSQSFINSTTINTEQLAKGIYLYEVRNKNGVIKKGKVVKE